MSHIRRLLFAALSCALLQACASQNYGEDSNLIVAHTNDLPQPSAADFTGERRAYLVGPLDRLKVDVFGVEALSKMEIQVDASGGILIPLAGPIQAGGRTPAEVAEMIAARLRGNYVRDPQVAVNLVETVSQTVAVDGEVETPGIYPALGDMTLLRAIATAGGTTEFARKENVVIFRTVGGQRFAGLYNLEGIRRGNYPDPDVYPNDVIVVDDSSSLRRFERLLQITPLLTSPLVLLLR